MTAIAHKPETDTEKETKKKEIPFQIEKQEKAFILGSFLVTAKDE